MAETSRPRVVIIGGGFGGLSAARALARAQVDVMLIDRRNHHVFSPLLYQVATAGLSPGDIASPIRWILRKQKNLTVWLAEATAIDPARKCRAARRRRGRRTTTSSSPRAAARRTSATTSGRRTRQGLKTMEDALEMRRQVLIAFERAERERDRAGAAQAPDVRRRRRRPDWRGACRSAGRDLAARAGARLSRDPSRDARGSS